MQHQDCPPDVQIESLVEKTLDATERSQIEAHLAHCRLCRERLAETLAATQLAESIRAPQELKRIARGMVAGNATSARRSGQRGWLPLAAAIVLVIGVAVIWRSGTLDRGDQGEPGDVLRNVSTLSTLELVAPYSGEVLQGANPRFQWQPIEGVRHYDFQLVDQIGEIVFETQTTHPSLQLTAKPQASQGAPAHYWIVRATLRDGSVVESELRRVAF